MVSAVISTVGSLVGANKAANAAKDAASLQSAAANQASSLSQAQYEQSRQDMMPWLEAGKGGLTKLSDLLGTSTNTTADGYGSLLKPFSNSDFEADPGYQFRMDEGMKALQRTQSAKGGLLSGAATKEAQRFGQGLASDEYGAAYNRFNQNQSNIYNRLAGLSGTGQTSAQQVGALGANNVANVGNLLTSGAAAQAGGLVGAGNAWNTGLQNIGSTWSSQFSGPNASASSALMSMFG